MPPAEFTAPFAAYLREAICLSAAAVSALTTISMLWAARAVAVAKMASSGSEAESSKRVRRTKSRTADIKKLQIKI
jgi:hypothetical protein